MISIGELLMFSAPVALAALGESITQTSGLINIGLEGQMLAAAYAAVATTYATQNPFLGILAGCLAGIVLALGAGWFLIRLASDQVVVGAAINLFALGLTGTLFRAQFGQSGRLLSVAHLPKFGGLDPVLWLMIVLVAALALIRAKTAWGLAARAAGESPVALEAAGFRVEAVRFQALAIGGLLGGLAGAYLSVGIAGGFAENMTAGRGFVAIALVTFGRWKPAWVFASAIFIGYLESLQFQLQANSNAAPFQLLIAAPYAVALITLAIFGRAALAPQALGTPYRRER